MWTKVPSQDGGVSRGVSSGGNMAGDISRMVVGNKRCLYSLPLTIVALLGGAWLAAQFYAGQGLPDVQVCVLVYMRVGGVSMRERVPGVRVDMCVRAMCADTRVCVCVFVRAGHKRCLYCLPLTIVALLGGAWLAAQFYAGQGLPDVQVCVFVCMRVGGVSMRERVPCVRVDMCVRVFVDTSVWVCAVCAGGEQEVPLLSASRHCPFCWKARAWVLPHTYKFRS